MKNKRPFSLDFPSVIIAGPLFQSRDEAEGWATDLETGKVAEDLVPAAVGRGCGYSHFPPGIHDLRGDDIDHKSGVRVYAYHELFKVRETDDGWIPHVKVGILAAPPIQELRHRASKVLVAGPLCETTMEAHGWFRSLDDGTRFYPMAIGREVGHLGRIRDVLSPRAAALREIEGVDLANGITASKRLVYRTIKVDSGWTSVFEADIRYAKSRPAPANSTVFSLNPAAAIH